MAEIKAFKPFGTPGLEKGRVYDRFGRPLDVGDVVYVIGKLDVMWHVANTQIILDPKAPPGLQEVTLTANWKVLVPGGTPVGDVLKVLDGGQVEAPKVGES